MDKVFSDAADAKGYPKVQLLIALIVFDKLTKSINFQQEHFVRSAPAFYYLKVRLGLCVPASCSLDDLNIITENCKYNLIIDYY